MQSDVDFIRPLLSRSEWRWNDFKSALSFCGPWHTPTRTFTHTRTHMHHQDGNFAVAVVKTLPGIHLTTHARPLLADTPRGRVARSRSMLTIHGSPPGWSCVGRGRGLPRGPFSPLHQSSKNMRPSAWIQFVISCPVSTPPSALWHKEKQRATERFTRVYYTQ